MKPGQNWIPCPDCGEFACCVAEWEAETYRCGRCDAAGDFPRENYVGLSLLVCYGALDGEHAGTQWTETEPGSGLFWASCDACGVGPLWKRGQRSESRREWYHRYLLSEPWQRRREAALERADHRCQVCNGWDRLNVHHRTYERVGQEELGDLTVLCRRCHEAFHKVIQTRIGEPAISAHLVRKDPA